MTATPCVLASAMRGTLMARVMVAKERTPSGRLLARCMSTSEFQGDSQIAAMTCVSSPN